MQEIQLDKHVKLLECPGIVMATGSSDTQIILKNVVKVCLLLISQFRFVFKTFEDLKFSENSVF